MTIDNPYYKTNQNLSIGEGCSKCGAKLGKSPTGSWCNLCGYSDPCECWNGDHKGCMNRMNVVRKKTGYPLSETCCCKRLKSERKND